MDEKEKRDYIYRPFRKTIPMPLQKTSREEILVKAMRVFRLQGYHHSSMADLARACGVQKAHMYYYFENKEALMRAVLEAVLSYAEARVFPLAYEDERSPEARIEDIIGQLRRLLAMDQGGCLMANTALEVSHLQPAPDFLAVVRAFFEQLLDALTHLLKHILPPEAAQSQAETQVAALEGALLLSQVYEDPAYFERGLERLSALFTPIA
ncbi:MAG: TetR/AcrR family transcriptional regulator [Bacteroidetes bacterium]|nr:MAG: TetR/AcrR family transcriptional regulator [Bacteroidota bacterium]